MNRVSRFKLLYESPKVRITMMLAFLAIVVTVGLFAYDYYSYYEGYPHEEYNVYDDYHEYDEGNGYEDYQNYYIDDYSHIGYGPGHYYDNPYDFVDVDGEMIYIGAFEVFDYENNLMAFGDNLFYICIESMSGISIGPLMNIQVHFSPNGGDYIAGHNDRTTYTGDATGGTIGSWRMPLEPSHPAGFREFMGWNTQADGRGSEFTGDTWVCADDGPFIVYAKWGVNVTFSGNGATLVMGTDQNNENHFVTRGLVPLGWSINETPGMVFPRDLSPSDWALHTFWGWFDTNLPIGGTRFFFDTPITGPTNLHARWTAPNLPEITFDPGIGQIPGTHNPVRVGRLGMSIFAVGSPPGPHDPPRLNYDRLWPRSAPLATLANATLEGWWTQPGGWDGAGTRWASPGSDNTAADVSAGTWPTVLPHPSMYLHTPITGSMTVHAHWVFRVLFHPNEGQPHPQEKGFPGYPGRAADVSGGIPASPGYPSHHYYPTYPLPVGLGTGFILFRDIPLTNSGSNIATHGRQFNREDGTYRDRQYVPMGGLPVLADNCISRPGYNFNGWWDRPLPASPYANHASNPRYSGATGEAALAFAAGEFLATTAVSASRTVFAHWIRNDRVIITFDPQGGTWEPNLDAWNPMPQVPSGTQDLHFIDLPQDGTIQATPTNHLNAYRRTMPTFPVKEGYIFIGWFSHPWVGNEGGREFRCSTTCARNNNACATPGCRGRGVFMQTLQGQAEGHRKTWYNISRATHSRTVYAHWIPYVQVILNPNGGVSTDARGYRLIGFGYVPSNANNSDVRVNISVMNNIANWNQSVNGAPGDLLTLPNATFTQIGAISRPGFNPMISQWQWRQTAPTGPLGTPQHWYDRWQTVPPTGRVNLITTGEASTQWNLSPDGTSHFFGNGSYVDAPRFEDYIEIVNGRRTMTLYAQWAVPVVFNPNVGVFGGAFLETPLSRTVNIATGHSYNSRINHRHTPPKFQIPPGAPPAPQPGFIYTIYWPDPSTPGGNWWTGLGAVQYQNQPVGSFFVEWNTCPNGTGDSFSQSDFVPFLNPETFIHHPVPLQLYAIWGGVSLTFSCGTPCNGHRDGVAIGCNSLTCDYLVTASNRTINLVSGQPLLAFPPEPSPPPGSGLEFYAWFTTPATGGSRLGLGVGITTSMHFYARWRTAVHFNPNGGQLANNAISSILAQYNAPIWESQLRGLATSVGDPTRPQPPGSSWTFGRWNTQADGRGAEIIEDVSPLVVNIPQNAQGRRYVFARWNGLFRFDLAGGTINGNNYPSGLDTIVPEFFSINEALASTVTLIANNARLPENPVHSDPSMVFMGWRITNGPLASNNILTRTQVGNIILNGYVNPDDEDCIDRNAPNGRIELEAVWHQRLVFTKTGELLYESPRTIQSRDGAEFEIRRLNTVTSNWDLVPGKTVSISGDAVLVLGTNTGNTPFAQAQPTLSGRVIAHTPFTSGGQYRLIELLPPLGYMREGGHWNIVLSPPGTDVRILDIVPVGHYLDFIDINAPVSGPQVLPSSWHVGNRRPRLSFTKLDRFGDGLDGVRFVVERRVRTDAGSPWGNWMVVYEAQPSGTAIPVFPGQPTPSPTPIPSDGIVVITQPLTPNTPSTTVEYRLREVAVPNNSGYLIPILGRWNIETNRYSGVENIVVCTDNPVAPNFMFMNIPGANLNNPNYPWDGYWSVGNTPARYWPFLKTNQYLTETSTNHTYLDGAVFRLYVYNGIDEPPDVLVTADMVVPPPTTPQPGTWSLVQQRESDGGSPPNPMWFPMMPGRYYQMVEVLAPQHFQIPWGQWRITVDGAVNSATIRGTHLDTRVISAGHGVGTPPIIRRVNHVTGDCIDICPVNCSAPHIYAGYLVSNRPDFDLPMTGGTGSMMIMLAGASVIGLGVMALLIMVYKRRKGADSAA